MGIQVISDEWGSHGFNIDQIPIFLLEGTQKPIYGSGPTPRHF